MNAIVPIRNDSDEVNLVIERVLTGLDSPESVRQYRYMLNRWVRWCDAQAMHPLMSFQIPNVQLFLLEFKAISTREAYLASIRKLVEYMAIHSQAYKVVRDELAYMKLPRAGATERKRKQSLTRKQVHTICHYWLEKQDNPFLAIRNQAFICLTFATGARISEIAAARFENIRNPYQPNGLFEIVHGKGDKYRLASILDSETVPVWDALRALEAALPTGYQHLFPAVNKGSHWAKDSMLSKKGAQQIIETTAQGCGIEFHHHLARFTLGTNLVRHGGEKILRDVMAQLGHSSPTTLLNHYVAAIDSEERFKKLATGWDD